MSEFKITFISHACILIEYADESILVDPWLFGSCYWKSWWNYPPVKTELVGNIKPTAVYLTHVHWDHWHGPSLKRYISKDTLIITHEEPNKRSVNDLLNLGYHNLRILKHGQRTTVGGIALTVYQFGLFLNDSAVVIEAGGYSILNANDCKIAGVALRNIVNNHGQFTFALRSHSSANDRICYTIKDSQDFLNDDSEHYSRAFCYFMDAVKPKYAIPFASNHCHLHKDVYHLNSYINDPFQLFEKIADYRQSNFWEYRIMLSGDNWSSEDGFSVNQSQFDWFADKENKLKEYLSVKQSNLNNFYTLENNLRLSDANLLKFSKQLNSIPKIVLYKIKNWNFVLRVYNDNIEYYYDVHPYLGKVVPRAVDIELFQGSLISIPIKIFRDAVNLNMFHHSSISKRNSYVFKNVVELRKFEYFLDCLELVELEVFPLKFSYFFHLFNGYLRRWRELFVYATAFFYKKQGYPMYIVEEKILRKT
jgi:UDP-MurNAc hydroxylase